MIEKNQCLLIIPSLSPQRFAATHLGKPSERFMSVVPVENAVNSAETARFNAWLSEVKVTIGPLKFYAVWDMARYLLFFDRVNLIFQNLQPLELSSIRLVLAGVCQAHFKVMEPCHTPHFDQYVNDCVKKARELLDFVGAMSLSSYLSATP